VKGIDRPLRAYEVEGETTSHAHHAEEPPFVGRDSEMELLRLVFSRAVRERRPNLATVSGPPGIGKSRLTQEVVEVLRVERPDVQVVRGRCLPYGDGLTYWPLAEILKADAGILDSDAPGAILEKATAALGARFEGDEGLATALVLLSSIGVSVPSDPLAGAEPPAAQRMIARAWQRYLESLASASPLVAVIEDIHWGDPSLLELIESVVSRASGPALVLCTARPDLFERRPNWGGGLMSGTSVALSPLSAGESAMLLEHLLGGDAPPEVVGPILHRSEGNPFFATELLRMMTEDGTLAMQGGRWMLERDLPSMLPDTVQGVISSRIDLLAPVEKRAIQDASVVGRVFWQGAVERLGGSAAALDALLDKGLVLEREGSSIRGERELTFNHILTRDVAYGSIPRARRAEAHATVGTWVEEHTKGRAGEFAEILAFHFEQADDGPRTARYALLAGNRHRRVFAAEEAIRWYDRGLSAAPDADLVGRLALARGQAREQIGQLREAKEDYEAALERSRADGDQGLEARALAALAHVCWILDRYDEGQALLPEALERARAVGAADVEARLLYTAGTIQFGRGAFEEAIPLHEEALRVAEASGDLEGQGLAHHGLCETHFFTGPPDVGLAHGERADELLRSLGQRQMVAHNAYMISWLQWFVGDRERALETVEVSIGGSREIGNQRDEAFALLDRAEISFAGGEVSRALADARAALAIMRDVISPRGEMIAQGVIGFVLSDLWAVHEMVEAVEAAKALSDSLGGRFMRGPTLALLGTVAAFRGDAEGAARWFEEAWRTAGTTFLDRAWTGRQEVLALEHDADAARLEAVGAEIEALSDSAPSLTVWGTYALALGAWVRGDAELALERAARAITVSDGASKLRVRWRAGGVAARALGALGRAGGAEAARAEARAVVERFVTSTPGDLRASFLARPDVAELFGGA
jgi:tetratricopeptide (TPR) repeat protein